MIVRNICNAVFIFAVLSACSKPGKAVEESPVKQDTAILWGSSFGVSAGETKAAAYNRVKSAFKNHQVTRVYCAADPEWPSYIPKESVVHISFKMNAKDVLNGSKDAILNSFFASLGSIEKIYWTYFHEPEDDIRDGAFTAGEYRDAFDYIVILQKKLSKPNLVPTLCLMSYSLDPASKRNWKDYLPARVELISWDGYYRDTMGDDVSKVFSDVRDAMKQVNLPWAIAETGVNKMKKSGQVNEPMDIETRKKLLAALAKDISTTLPLPVFVEYFDSDPSHDAAYSDWRISDDTTMLNAWQEGQRK